MKKDTDSGRTLLETLSVLVVMAILIIACLLGYNYLKARHERQETVEMATELAIRYKVNPIRPKKDGRIAVKTVYPVPESMRIGDVLKAPDKKGATIYLEAGEDTSIFSVFSKDIQPSTCQELLESGNYETFVSSDSGSCSAKEHTGRLITKKAFERQTAEERQKLIDKICSERICVHLVYGESCKNGGYFYDYECHACEAGLSEDAYGACCAELNACGICACPNGGVCKSETQECVECLTNGDCKDGTKPICDLETNTCVECTKNEDCKSKGDDYKCDLSTHTCTECKEEHGVKWNAELGICDCAGEALPLGSTCSAQNNCCQRGLACRDFGEGDYKCAECQTHPDCQNPDYPVCKDERCVRCPKTPTKEGDECYSVCDACPSDIGLTCGTDNKCLCSDNFHWNGSKCVECLDSTHCAGTDTPWCDPSDNTCKKCTSNYGVGGDYDCPTIDLPWCDDGACKSCKEDNNKKWHALLKKCTECTQDSHCGSGKYCKNNGTCIDCEVNTWCGGCYAVDATKPYWNGTDCVSCLANYGTGKTGACETESSPVCNEYVCKTCEAADPLKPYWNETLHECTECTQHSHCENGQICNLLGVCGCPKNQTRNESGECYCDPEIYEEEPQEDGSCVCRIEDTVELSLDSYAPNGNYGCRITLAEFGKLKGRYYFKYISGGHYYACGAAYPKYETHVHSDGQPYPSSGTESLIFDFQSPPGWDPNFVSRAKKSKKYFDFDGEGEISLVFYDDYCYDNCGTMQLELRKVSDRCRD